MSLLEMNEQERTKRAEHFKKFIAEIYEFRGLTVIPCRHIEDGEEEWFRSIQAGEGRIFMLCRYCSGRLMEEVLDDLRKILNIKVPKVDPLKLVID